MDTSPNLSEALEARLAELAALVPGWYGADLGDPVSGICLGSVRAFLLALPETERTEWSFEASVDGGITAERAESTVRPNELFFVDFRQDGQCLLIWWPTARRAGGRYGLFTGERAAALVMKAFRIEVPERDSNVVALPARPSRRRAPSAYELLHDAFYDALLVSQEPLATEVADMRAASTLESLRGHGHVVVSAADLTALLRAVGVPARAVPDDAASALQVAVVYAEQLGHRDSA